MFLRDAWHQRLRIDARSRTLGLAVLVSACCWGSLGDAWRDFDCPDCIPEDQQDVSEALSSLLQVSHTHHRGPGSGKPVSPAAGNSEAPVDDRVSCHGVECLQNFVREADPEYSWRDTLLRLNGTSSGIPWTGSVLSMTSQRWLSDIDTKSPIWTHALVVIRPENLEGNHTQNASWATLYASFGWYGSLGGPPLESLHADLADVQAAAQIAVWSGALAAVVFAVPPKVDVALDGKRRDEDDLVTHGMLRYMQTHGQLGAEKWLVELPMTKAVVRAMDTVAHFSADALLFPVNSFVIMGTSKRGGVAWHAAAVDPRVRAVVPIGKALDSKAFARRAIRCLGGMPAVAAPYASKEITHHSERVFEFMRNITDPIMYADRYRGVAKLIIDATQDEYFMPDHASLWWSKLPGPKTHLMVPNSGHIIGDAQVLALAPTIGTFVRTVVVAQGPPPLTWTIDRKAGRLVAWLPRRGPKPVSVQVWQATTCDERRRDFRLHNHDTGENCTRCGVEVGPPDAAPPALTCENRAVRWRAQQLQETSAGSRTWVVHVPPPKDGRWTAFFITAELPGAPPPGVRKEELQPNNGYKQSTEVVVVPDTFPYPDPGDNVSSQDQRFVFFKTSAELA